MTRVAILGGTGYTALELIRILLRHPQAKITAVTSRSETGHIGEVHPSLYGRLDLRLENLTPAQIRERADVVFGCLPHVASMEIVPQLLEAGLKVVDLSADYRLNDAAVYEKWYGGPHKALELQAEAVYGLTEHYREEIRKARLVACPGCYPTAVLMMILPLAKAGLIKVSDLVIDAKPLSLGAYAPI